MKPKFIVCIPVYNDWGAESIKATLEKQNMYVGVYVEKVEDDLPAEEFVDQEIGG